MKRRTLKIALTATAAALSLPPFAAAEEGDAERLDIYKSRLKNVQYYTVDTPVPVSPGLVLAGMSPLDDIDHDIGSDLVYSLSINENGKPQLGLSLRPYWSLFQMFRSPKSNFGRYEAFKESGYGPFDWLKRTQVSVGAGTAEKGGVERLGFGFGAMFYPLSGTDPRRDAELNQCLAAVVSGPGVAVFQKSDEYVAALTDDGIKTIIGGIDVIAPDINLYDANVRTALGEKVIERGGVYDIGEDYRIPTEGFTMREPKKTRASLTTLVGMLVAERAGGDKTEEERQALARKVIDDFNVKFDRRPRPDLSDEEINALLASIGVANPIFKRRAADEGGALAAARAEIDAHLRRLPESQRPGEDLIALVLSDFDEKMRNPAVRAKLSAEYVEILLRIWVIEAPGFKMPAVVALPLAEQVDAYLEGAGADQATRAAASDGLRTLADDKLAATYRTADLSDFLRAHGLTGYDAMPGDKVSIAEIGKKTERYLDDLVVGTAKAELVSDDGVVRLTGEVEDVVIDGANAASDPARLLAGDVKKCRDEATKRYQGKREFTVGFGLAGKSMDASFDNLAFAGVSAWGRYRVPIFLSGRKDENGKDRAPDGGLAAFVRYTSDDSVVTGKDPVTEQPISSDANIFVAGVTADATRKNLKFSLGVSYNDRNLADPLIDDQNFWRASVSLSRRVSERVWLTGEFGEVLGDTPFDDGSYGRISFEVDGGLIF